MNQKLSERMSYCFNETDINFQWRLEFTNKKLRKFNYIQSVGTSDGYVTWDKGDCFIETKSDQLIKKRSRSILIGQAIMTIYNYFIKKSILIPSSILGADRHRCFLILKKDYEKYLYEDYINWDCSPSQVAINNPKLIDEIDNDSNLNSIIYEIIEDENIIEKIIDQIECYNRSEIYFTNYKITQENILIASSYFDSFVLIDSFLKEEERSQFFLYMIAPDSIRDLCIKKHHSKPIYLWKNNKEYEVRIDLERLEEFFKRFKKLEDQESWNLLVSCSDVIIKNIKRRRSGAFYTPPIPILEAYKMMDSIIGENWKDDFWVWDMSAGKANLTRSYSFSNLFISTLDSEDIEIIKEANYNPEAREIFQFDFLNDSLEKLPELLKTVLDSGLPIVTINNPPYAQATSLKNENIKEKVSETKVSNLMKRKNLGTAHQELFNQFLFRIIEITKECEQLYICTFTKARLLSKPMYKELREYFQDNKLNYVDGFCFDAKAFGFSDVDQLPISFTIFKRNEKLVNNISPKILKTNKEKIIEKIYPLKIKTMNESKTGMSDNGTIMVSECNYPLKKFCIDKYKSNKNIREVCMITGAIKINPKIYKVPVDFLGYYATDSNRSLVLFSTVQVGLHGVNIVPKNFKEVICLFMATMVLLEDLDFLKDLLNFHVPKHPIPEEWINDCIVISLFSNYSFQSSIRRIQTKYEKKNIFNEFFWLSKNEMLELAIKYNFKEMIEDITNFGLEERYLFNMLKDLKISDEARNILNLSKELVIKSFEFREQFNNKEPKFFLETWDAGWYQIKNSILKQYFKNDLILFNSQLKNLIDRLKKRIFEFGIIK